MSDLPVAPEPVRFSGPADRSAGACAGLEPDLRPECGEVVLRAQRDLAITLVCCENARECLCELLDVALRLPGFDCGGSYLIDDATGELELTAHRGLSDGFIRKVARYPREAVQSSLVRRECVFFGSLDDLPPPMARNIREEGLKAVAVLPLMLGSKVVGSLNLATRRTAEITQEGRMALGSIAALAQSAFASIQERQEWLRVARQLRLAVEGTKLGVWRADLVTRRFYASARARELHGVPMDKELTV